MSVLTFMCGSLPPSPLSPLLTFPIPMSVLVYGSSCLPRALGVSMVWSSLLTRDYSYLKWVHNPRQWITFCQNLSSSKEFMISVMFIILYENYLIRNTKHISYMWFIDLITSVQESLSLEEVYKPSAWRMWLEYSVLQELQWTPALDTGYS